MENQYDDTEMPITPAQSDKTPLRQPWHRPQLRAVTVADETEVKGVAVVDGGVFS